MLKSIVLIVFIVPLFLFANQPEKEKVKFGSARANITPTKPIHMSGYDARKSVSTGVHDELFASALCFSNQDSKVLFITAKADLILLFGTNPPVCHPPFMAEFADAKANGANLVVIDPRLNPIACKVTRFFENIMLAW